MKNNVSVLFVVGVQVLLICGCESLSFTNDKTFHACQGLRNQSPWVVLSRPNSKWVPGAMINLGEQGQPEILGNFLQCFSESSIETRQGKGAEVKCEKSVRYDLSLGATINIEEIELVRLGLNIGSGDIPNYYGEVVINSSVESYLDQLKLEDDILNNYSQMSKGCKLSLLDSSRFIVGEVYQVEEGEINIIKNDGARVDLTVPEYEILKNAAIGAGYSISESGGMIINKDKGPLTFAVRPASFEKALKELGFVRRVHERDFLNRMERANLTVRR